MELRTVRAIAQGALDTADQRAWADALGTDYGRAWSTAPSIAVLCFLAAALASRAGYLFFVRQLLEVYGGDGEDLERLSTSLHSQSSSTRDATLSLLGALPGLEVPEAELIERLRARVPFDRLQAPV